MRLMNLSAKELRRNQYLCRVYCDIIREHLRTAPEINNYCLFLVMVSDTLYVSAKMVWEFTFQSGKAWVRIHLGVLFFFCKSYRLSAEL